MRNLLMLCSLVPLLFAGCQGQGGDQSASSSPKSDAGSSTASPAVADASGGGYAKVQKVFDQSCVKCHGAGKPKAGINLTSFDAVMKGSTQGAIVKAGDPAGSVLVQALRSTNGMRQMPPRGGPIPEDQIKTVEDWIKAGAKSS